MRTHADIIQDAGGPTKMARAINEEPNTAFAWKREDSIPAAYWPRVVESGFATLDELAAAAEARKFPDLAAERVAARQDEAAA